MSEQRFDDVDDASEGLQADQRDPEPLDQADNDAEAREHGEASTTALSLVDVARLSRGNDAARELFHAMSELMHTLNLERNDVRAADEKRRDAEEKRRAAEIENARLGAELEKERALRDRVEKELQDMKAEVEGRRERARAALDRILSAREEESPRSRTLSRPAADSWAPTPPPPSPTRRESGGGDPARLAPGIQSGSVDPTPIAATTPAQGQHPHGSPPQSRADQPGRAGAPIQQDPPPLPPGWRYASEIEPHRRRWRLPWLGRRSDSP